MRKMKLKRGYRFLAFALVLLTLFSIAPVTALASTQANPNIFTFSVKNQDGQTIADVKIDYDVYHQGNHQYNGSLTTDGNGEAALDLSGFSMAVSSGEDVCIDYTVTKDGYCEQNVKQYKVLDVNANIDIVMEEIIQSCNLTVENKNPNNGIVKINNSETSGVTTVNEGEEVSIEVIPNQNCYIKELRIGETDVEVAEGKSYIGKLIVSENTEIVVDFVKKCKAEVDVNNEDGGRIFFNRIETNALIGDENTIFNFSIEANNGYRIASVKFDGVEQTVDSDLTFSADYALDSDIKIEVEFVQTFTVTVNCDENGVINTQPVNSGGIVKVDVNSVVHITAIPNENYRVSKVVINGETEVELDDNTFYYINENDNNPYTKELTVDKDYRVEVTFTKMFFTIKANEDVRGDVNIDDDTVDWNDGTKVSVIPKEGYAIKSITVNNIPVTEINRNDVYADNDSAYSEYIFEILNITENQNIVIEYKEKENADKTAAELFNSETAIRSNGNLYIYDENQNIIFKTDDDAIRLLCLQAGSTAAEWITKDKDDEIIINDNVVIYGVQLLYSDGNGEPQYWHSLSDVSGSNPLVINYDKEGGNIQADPVATPNENKIYNQDVEISVTADDDPNNTGVYSGIKRISYQVYSDYENESNPGTLTQEEDLYVFTDSSPQKDDIQKSISATFKVDAGLNNSDKVRVIISAEDNAENEFEKKEIDLKISTEPPKMTVKFEDKAETIADERGYFGGSRKAYIKIEDNDFSFDGEAASRAILDGLSFVSAADNYIKPENLSWNKTEKEGEPHLCTFTATVDFTANGAYSWNIGDYVNKADNVCKSDDISYDEQSGDSYSLFTVDTKKPEECTVEIRENPVNTILDVLTFGLITNEDVDIYANAKDKTSPVKVEYYKTDNPVALSLDELKKQSFTDINAVNNGSDGAGYEVVKAEVETISKNEQLCVYLKVTDYAGNTTYVRSDGVIVDKERGELQADPVATPNENEIYNQDVEISVTADDDPNNTGVYSGIKRISYQVYSDYENESNPGTLTQEEDLYVFTDSSPQKDDIQKSISATFKVDAGLNNSDKVRVIISAEDNAENEFEKKEIDLKISTEPPKMTVKFEDKAETIADERGYFGGSRKAYIKIEDNDFSFDGEAASRAILDGLSFVSAADNYIKPENLSWNKTEKEGEPHLCTFTATVDFTANGAYSWNIGDYVNKADNVCKSDDISYDEQSGDSYSLFTVDTKKPEECTVEIRENPVNTILDVLTFGLITNEDVDIYANAKDKTSPVKVEYYKTDNPVALSLDELKKQSFTDINAVNNGSDGAGYEVVKAEVETISKNEQLCVYLKVTDYAGNTTYVRSDGVIVDKLPPQITLAPEKANSNNIYNDDVEVNVTVEDMDIYSGIQNIEYWIEIDGEAEKDENGNTKIYNLYSFAVENPTKDDLVKSFSRDIKLDSKIYNSCSVKVNVRAFDNAENESLASVELDIDSTAPRIDISYDNNLDNGGNSYFDAMRTATIKITERTHHFDKSNAKSQIKVTAVDVNGNPVADAFNISEWTTKEDKLAPDNSTHTAKVYFVKDANYTLSVSYTDKAGNKNSTINTNGSTSPFDFTIDTTAPAGVIRAVSAEGKEKQWSALNDNLTFGFWSSSKISISGSASDKTSPVASVKYYKATSVGASDATTALTASQLNSIKEWKEFSGFDVYANEQFTVYLKIEDFAGNYTYISTDGLIVDNQSPRQESIAPEITVSPQQPVNGIYNGDVKVSIKVDDPLVGGTYSGLNEISYSVFNKSVSADVPTQSGKLFVFENSNPKQGELIRSWTGEIVVDSQYNNSNDVQIVVYATDNSLNSSQDDVTIQIDTTPPEIDISYDNNNAENITHFNEDRTATIVVTERNFDSEYVDLEITNSDGIIPEISGWTKITTGDGNLDNTKWSATVRYTADGDYSFSINCKDMAGNGCSDVRYASSTVAGDEFTMDKTKPEITVNYDNNSAENENFYNSDRTATVIVKEHNFDPDDVKIDLTASDDGKPSSVPQISQWTTNGDTHAATIKFDEDSYYTLDIAYTDKAGNSAAKFDKQSFFIDKTAPSLKITGVKDQSANNAEVVPVITYSDTNYDDSSVDIVLKGANRGEIKLDGEYSQIENGAVFTFNNFESKKEVDDIYTLSASIIDKAGNISEQSITFSVNRFGSTYALSDETKQLNGTYVQTPIDAVVTETNVDKLSNIKITLFKNNETMTLLQGEDYSLEIEGGEGKWYKYTYTILSENFKDDAVYRLVVHSEDEAGNVAENTLDTKKSEISFGVDKTSPTANVSNLESGKTYALDNMTVNMSVNDNLKLDSVVVYLDEKEHMNLRDDELEEVIQNGGETSFEIAGGQTSSHTVEIVLTDAAGNVFNSEIEDFYVTTNLWVRYYTNKPLFYGSIAGVVIIVGLIVLLVIFRRQKRDNNRQKSI